MLGLMRFSIQGLSLRFDLSNVGNVQTFLRLTLYRVAGKGMFCFA